MNDKQLTFWDHLDELRAVLFRVIIVVVVVSAAAFMLKEQLFSVVLAPKDSGFITYGLLQRVALFFSDSVSVTNFDVDLINTQLSRQFMVHVKVAMYVGFLCVFPYVLFEIFRFVSPALYQNERKYAGGFISVGYVMFLLGVALSYFLIFPLTFRFLASYQVSEQVVNIIALDSYIDTLMMLNLMMGLVFELPILCWLFAKLGFLTAGFMRQYRRHAIVLLLLISAIITPTADILTLILVALPMYFLYEISILIVSFTQKKDA